MWASQKTVVFAHLNTSQFLVSVLLLVNAGRFQFFTTMNNGDKHPL